MSFPVISERARRTPASPIRRLSHLARLAEQAGKTVYHLNIGQPDLTTPPEFLEGLKQFQSKIVAYEASEGNHDLREAWVGYMNRTLDLNLSTDQLLVTMGASEALVFLFMTLCDPGDEVVIFDPTYANYMGFAAIAGVSLSSIVTNLEDNFSLPDMSEVEAKISPKTKAILLCSPNNPTGTVYSREELQALLEVCEKKNLYLVVDETYRELVYDGLDPLSIFHVAPTSERVIVLDSLSKRFSLCGARIGCLITYNQEILRSALNLAQARLSAPTVEQYAAAFMLSRISDDIIVAARQEYQRRRDVLYECLKKIPGVVVHRSAGAFYTIARFPVDDCEDFARFMLEDFSSGNETVFLAPANGFYMSNGRGSNKVRIAYVLNSESIERSVELIGSGLEEYQS